MFCQACGAKNLDGVMYCCQCGAVLTQQSVVNQPAQPVMNQPVQPEVNAQPVMNQNAQMNYYGQPVAGSMNQPASGTQPVFMPQEGYGMPADQVSNGKKNGLAWAYFLGYGALWIGAIINIITGIPHITGSYLGYNKNSVYAYFEALQILDILYGLVVVAVAVLGIVTALCIILKKKAAVVLVPAMYFANCAFGALYLMLLAGITGELSAVASGAGAIVVSLVMGIVNIIYFRNRRHIFCK